MCLHHVWFTLPASEWYPLHPVSVIKTKNRKLTPVLEAVEESVSCSVIGQRGRFTPSSRATLWLTTPPPCWADKWFFSRKSGFQAHVALPHAHLPPEADIIWSVLLSLPLLTPLYYLSLVMSTSSSTVGPMALLTSGAGVSGPAPHEALTFHTVLWKASTCSGPWDPETPTLHTSQLPSKRDVNVPCWRKNLG